jgi:hypothetical protein
METTQEISAPLAHQALHPMPSESTAVFRAGLGQALRILMGSCSEPENTNLSPALSQLNHS